MIATRVREARKALDLSQQQASSRAGLTIRTWASIEAGENVRLDTLLSALTAVGLTLDVVEAPDPEALEAVG